jgi:hypothetical protein
MIDPFTALAAVQTAVKLVKKTVETIRDVESLGPVLGKYFDAKSQAIEVVQASKAKGFKGSSLGQAIELELAIEQAVQFEKQVEMLFFQSNKMDVWAKIKARAAATEKAYAEQQRLDKALAARKKQEAREATEIAIAIVLFACIIGFVGYSVYEILVHCKNNSCGYR